jgi:hypothetical protein
LQWVRWNRICHLAGSTGVYICIAVGKFENLLRHCGCEQWFGVRLSAKNLHLRAPPHHNHSTPSNPCLLQCLCPFSAGPGSPSRPCSRKPFSSIVPDLPTLLGCSLRGRAPIWPHASSMQRCKFSSQPARGQHLHIVAETSRSRLPRRNSQCSQ